MTLCICLFTVRETTVLEGVFSMFNIPSFSLWSATEGTPLLNIKGPLKSPLVCKISESVYKLFVTKSRMLYDCVKTSQLLFYPFKCEINPSLQYVFVCLFTGTVKIYCDLGCLYFYIYYFTTLQYQWSQPRQSLQSSFFDCKLIYLHFDLFFFFLTYCPCLTYRFRLDKNFRGGRILPTRKVDRPET